MAEANPTLTAALRSLLSATEFVAPNHDILSGGDAIACQKDLLLARQGAERALQCAIDHADLLRRYVRLVVQEEGYDFLPRLGTGANDVKFTDDELAVLKRLSDEATR